MGRTEAFREIPEHSDHMTIKQWLDAVENGFFIDYDGFGELATATQVSNVTIRPSDITQKKMSLPEWATHVVWYNR